MSNHKGEVTESLFYWLAIESQWYLPRCDLCWYW